MRYVATDNGEWCALLGFGSAALCVRSREELIGWSDEQRYRRLRYVTNNQRFCVLDDHRRPNLASQALAATMRRLSGDFEARWGHLHRPCPSPRHLLCGLELRPARVHRRLRAPCRALRPPRRGEGLLGPAAAPW
ncbi:MAG: Druantia anti-phage system protein DruA, partial [Acidimicrobiales bacterium]